MEVNYFQDDDDDTIYACIGQWGLDGIFFLKYPPAGEQGWKFLAPNSPSWDSVHQRIYLNCRVKGVNPDKLPGQLPPIPEIPRGPFPEWREHFLPAKPIQASQYPSITRLLKARKDKTVTVFILLFEDRYETLLGDGEFHYFKELFLTKEEVQRYIEQHQGEDLLHLRTMSIQAHQEVLDFPDFSPQLFDRFTVEEVLTALEARLRD